MKWFGLMACVLGILAMLLIDLDPKGLFCMGWVSIIGLSVFVFFCFTPEEKINEGGF